MPSVRFPSDPPFPPQEDETRAPGVWRAVQFWGLWPSLVMVLSQWEAARLNGFPIPMAVTAITFAGTLAVYGVDRGLQNLRFAQIEERHRPPTLSLPLFGLIIIGLTLFALPRLRGPHWYWLAGLSLGGLAYVLVTVRFLTAKPGVKELLGAFCFTLLVWGGQVKVPVWDVSAFFVMGLSNFLTAGSRDHERDQRNQISSYSQRYPKASLWLAGAFGIAAAIIFMLHTGPTLFIAVALAHAILAFAPEVSIDAAFIPLLLAPFL